MSLGSRIALVDDRSTASNPGGLPVQPFRFARHFPYWPVKFAALLLITGFWAVSKPALWPVPLVFLILNILFWTRVRLRFRYGCVNPSVVVSDAPFTLAVYTDLTTGAGEYPVIKIHPHPRPSGVRLKVGDKCATVAMYTGDGNADHWENFDPILAHCATGNKAALQHCLESIPPNEWLRLEAGMKHLPQPLKSGLYPFKYQPPETATPAH